MMKIKTASKKLIEEIIAKVNECSLPKNQWRSSPECYDAIKTDIAEKADGCEFAVELKWCETISGRTEILEFELDRDIEAVAQWI